MRGKKDLNTVTWMIYCGTALIVAATTRNPLYLLMLVMILWAVFASRRPATRTDAVWSGFIGFGLGFAVVSTLFNTLTSHYGQTVLFKLPRSLPVIGGNITAEAFVYGLSFGLVFLSTVTVFAVFNRVIDLSALLRLAPGALRQPAVLLSITYNFIPQTLLAASEIREAQKMRGYTSEGIVKNIAGTVTLFVPLIITGLEKSCTLAESMESRAYGSGAKATALKRRADWSIRDIPVVMSSAVFLIAFIVLKIAQPAILDYSPYPALTAPLFLPAAGLLFLLLLAPVAAES